jgi:hypothetical protein
MSSALKQKKSQENGMRDCNGQDSVQVDMVSEDFAYHLSEEKLPVDDIRWRLSNCQGDGVAFYGNVDLEEYLTKNKLRTKYRSLIKYNQDYGIGINISKSQSFYDHHNTMTVYVEQEDFSHDPTAKMYALMGELEDHLVEKVTGLSHLLEKKGYESFEYANSDKVIEEDITCNDYDFEESGHRTTIAE